jgi:hypothetical protein
VRHLRRSRGGAPSAAQVGHERKANAVQRKVRTVTGLTLIGLGVLGILLPIIPGAPLLIVGVALVGANHPWVRPFTVRLRAWRQQLKWKRSR